MSNTFGNLYRLTTFGESHGPAIGGIIDGILSGYSIDINRIQKALDRRKPGQSEITTQRQEEDKVEILSGIFEGQTLGTPIGFIIRNTNQNSNDYLKNIYRPSHADLTYDYKYGIRDWRGGGRASARETACRVVAGEFAKIILESYDIKIKAYTSQIGYIKLDTHPINREKWINPEDNIVRCPDSIVADEMISLIKRLRDNGNSVGGIVTCEITGDIPKGLGEPIYNKLQAELSSAMMSINGVKAFEYGMGFEGCSKYGQQMNDKIINTPAGIKTETNNSGGIQGGISNGMPIYFNVGFKPTATILREIETLDTDFNKVNVEIKGRHDPCIVPRAVPVVEAMAAIVILDQILLNNSRNKF